MFRFEKQQVVKSTFKYTYLRHKFVTSLVTSLVKLQSDPIISNYSAVLVNFNFGI